MKIAKSRSVKSALSIWLNKDDLILFLIEQGELPADIDAAEVKAVFHVPGGGDWSNEDVDIDEDNPVIITFEEVTYE